MIRAGKLTTLFLIFLIGKVILAYFFNFINLTFFNLTNHKFDDLSQTDFIVVGVIIGPLIETLIFQFWLYRFLKWIKVENDYLAIVIMSFAFSQAHWYHWLYVVFTFFNGCMLNTFYLRIYKLKGEGLAYALTTLLHAMYNLYGVLFT